MPVAIRTVFPNAVHRLCLWHVINKFQPLLNELYARFVKTHFKERFHSVIHHPLTTGEFEATWSMLLDEFGLHDDQTLKALYDIRSEWVPAYFKDEYCGTMISTQRSESVNNIVKLCHVDTNTPLHLFAKQMMKFIHRRKMDEATETYACTVRMCFPRYAFLRASSTLFVMQFSIYLCIVICTAHVWFIVCLFFYAFSLCPVNILLIFIAGSYTLVDYFVY